MQKKVSLILVYIVLCISVWGAFSQTLYAKQPSDVLKEKLENLLENAPDELAKEILMSLGIVLIDLDSLWTDSAAIEAYKEYLKNAYSQGLIGITESGFFVTQSVVEYTKQIFEECVIENLIWMPVITEKNLKASWFSSTESYYKAMSVLDSHDLVGFYRYGYTPLRMDFGCYVDDDGNYATVKTDHYAYTPIFFDLSDLVIHLNIGTIPQNMLNAAAYLTSTFGNDSTTNVTWATFYIDKNGVSAGYGGWKWNVGSGWTTPSYTGFRAPARAVFNPFYLRDLPSTGGNFEYFVPVASSKSDIHYVPVFASANAYKDWITGNGSYYKFDSGYTGGSITINPNADYSKITDAIADVMKQGIANGETMATLLSRMQATFSKTLAEISGTLGGIEDNTQETNSWLEKIYQLLEDQQEQIEDYFSGAEQSLDELIGLLSHTDETGKVTSIYDVLVSFLVLFRVQQEDLQAYMEASRDYMKKLPIELYAWISAATRDITDAIQEVVDAVKGISININPNDYIDPGGGDSGKSLWTQLGQGVAKILTAILSLMKTLIFKGLDALIYLVGVVGDNITGVFEDMEIYVDRVAVRFEGSNALLTALGGAMPEPLTDMLVIFIFVLIICAVVSYMRR